MLDICLPAQQQCSVRINYWDVSEIVPRGIVADIHCDGNPCSVQKQATLDSNLLLQAGWTQKHFKKKSGS